MFRGFLNVAAGVLRWRLFILFAVLDTCAAAPGAVQNGPWNLAALAKPPVVPWGATNGLVQELFYEGEPLNAKPTRIFAYLGRPADLPSARPLVAFLAITDEGGRPISSEHVELPGR